MRYAISLLSVMLVLQARADVVTMETGRQIEGVVLQDQPEAVTLRLAYGTQRIPRNLIRSIEKKSLPAVSLPAPRAATTGTTSAADRIANWTTVIDRLAAQPSAHDLTPIPATVIDDGVMKDVPYISHRCGTDYEVNIYGDPDHPAAIEIGLYRELLKDPKAKQNCIELIASALPNRTDAAIVRALNTSRDLVTRFGVTFEVTPPDAPDAYGGWWISVYNEPALEKARATQDELKELTVERNAVMAKPATDNDWNASDLKRSREPKLAVALGEGGSGAHAAPSTGRKTGMNAVSGSSAGVGGGRVYVRGYHKKDGTYVRAHTRKT